MAKTKKVKTTGRFGARYGVGIKKRVLKIEKEQGKNQPCPACGFRKLKRLAAGLYSCRKCGNKFAGGAYVPLTMSGEIVQKMVGQKAFLPHLAELIEVKEKVAEAGEETAQSERAEARKPKPKNKKETRDEDNV